MKIKGVLLGACVALALAAPARAGLIFDTTTGKGLAANGIAFMNGLYEGYVALSDKRSQALDGVDGEHFNHKARRAARRSSVMPDEVMDRELLDEDAAELAVAISRLRTAYDRGGRHLAPEDAAKAQVSYDCWIEAAEGANPDVGVGTALAGRRATAEACKADFEDAIAKVDAASNLRLTEAAKPEPAPPPPAPMPVPMPVPEAMVAPEPFIVHFDWDRADIKPAGERVIDEAVATANRLGIVDFSVTGHADRSGPEGYNLELSLRRANAVRDALIARGVKSGGISVAGRGEAEPAVATPDGVREPANRRVEIILL